MNHESLDNTIPLSKTTKFVVDNRGRTAPTADEGILLIATNCISNDRLYPSRESVRRVSEETYRTWFRSHPEPDDIILTLKGSQNGAVCLVPDPVDFVIAQDMVALRADEQVIDPMFLFAALRSPQVQWQIKNLDVSGVIPHFKKTDFDKLMLPYPSRHTQEKIGSLYYHISAKIEQNRRTGQALEKLARAVFKAWFVDFEPVKAKAAGQTSFPGMPPETFSALSDRFVDSELGPMPEGWEVGTLDDVVELQRGFDLPKSKRLDGQVPIYAASGINGWHNESRVKGPGVTTGRSGVLGNVFFADRDFWPLNTSLWVKEYKRSNPWHAYHLLQTVGLEKFNAGSAVPTLNRNHLRGVIVVIASEYLLNTFGLQCGAIFEFQKQIESESAKLAELRDCLLPRLLSGRVRVGDVVC